MKVFSKHPTAWNGVKAVYRLARGAFAVPAFFWTQFMLDTCDMSAPFYGSLLRRKRKLIGWIDLA